MSGWPRNGRCTLERLNGLERELRGIIESADTAGTDDEHDPEGATIAFERQHVAALLGQAREHLTQIDAAMRKAGGGQLRPVRALRPGHRRRPPRRPPGRRHVHELRQPPLSRPTPVW